MLQDTEERLNQVFTRYPNIPLVILFGSLATETMGPDSDIDLAVAAAVPLTSEQLLALMDDLALAFNRPVDLIDLRTVGEPMLGQILRYGIVVRRHATYLGEISYKHLIEVADFLPARQSILEHRRQSWIK